LEIDILKGCGRKIPALLFLKTFKNSLPTFVRKSGLFDEFFREGQNLAKNGVSAQKKWVFAHFFFKSGQ